MIELTQEERDKFAAYLEQEVEATKSIIQQMEKMGNIKMVTDHYKTEAAAQILVARKLRNTHNESI